MKTRIFTKTEYDELDRRLKGEKKNYKIWYRAKPKIEELLDDWFPRKKELEKLIKR